MTTTIVVLRRHRLYAHIVLCNCGTYQHFPASKSMCHGLAWRLEHHAVTPYPCMAMPASYCWSLLQPRWHSVLIFWTNIQLAYDKTVQGCQTTDNSGYRVSLWCLLVVQACISCHKLNTQLGTQVGAAQRLTCWAMSPSLGTTTLMKKKTMLGKSLH